MKNYKYKWKYVKGHEKYVISHNIRTFIQILTLFPYFIWCWLLHFTSFNFFFVLEKADLLPEEGIWLWVNGMPPLCALRTLSIGTILGPEAEGCVDWFLQPDYLKMLLTKLTFQLSRIGPIVLNFAFSVSAFYQCTLNKQIVYFPSQNFP